MEGIPDENAVAKAAELYVFDSEGRQVKFGDLFKDKKTILVFIREYSWFVWLPKPNFGLTPQVISSVA